MGLAGQARKPPCLPWGTSRLCSAPRRAPTASSAPSQPFPASFPAPERPLGGALKGKRRPGPAGVGVSAAQA